MVQGSGQAPEENHLAREGSGIQGDFNGDGYTDLAISVHDEDLEYDPRTMVNAGGVEVIYGSATGLTDVGNQFWTQDSPGILDEVEPYDEFGRNLAGGDFNGDGYWDLAIGVGREDLGEVSDAGAVHVIYGSAAGLTDVGNQFWTQDSPDILDEAEKGDSFGWNAGSADINGDGYDDLFVGVGQEDVGTTVSAGAVNLIYGSPTGLTAVGNVFFSQDDLGASDGAEGGDVFGRSFARGDFNGDGLDDMAINAQSEDLEGDPTIVDAGAVDVVYGSIEGPVTAGDQFWTQDSPGILDEAEDDDWFGRTGLDAGDFNGDGFADLAVGVLLEDIGTVVDAGAVNVIYGSPAGLGSAGNQLWTQDTPGVRDVAETGDLMGRFLQADDFDSDGFADLAIGVEAEDGGGALTDVGSSNVLYGSDTGLIAFRNQVWNQDSPGILDHAEAGDRYGRVVSAGDFNGDGFMDAVLGGGGEDIRTDVGTMPAAGALVVIYGSASGLTDVGNQFWSQESPGILDQAERDDRFGRWFEPQG